MDAAQTNIKKVVFCLAIALLLSAPFRASAAVPALVSSGTTVSIGSSACNDAQNITITSSDGSNQAFSIAVQYPSGNGLGNWLYASLTYLGGSTSTSTSINAQTTTTGVSLTLGLNTEIAANTATATVVLTPADGSPVLNITVFYTQNTSCGGNTGTAQNGSISLTPSNISLTAQTNGQQSQSITVQNITGGSYAFTPTVSPSNSWLSVSFSSLTVSAGGTTTITVTANAIQTPGVGTYVGSLTVTPQQGFSGTTLNLPVTFVVTSGTTTGTGGSGSTGTLTINGATSNVFTTPFYYVAPNTPGGECISIQDTTAGANSYSSSVSTTSGGNWLLANNAINTTTLQILAPGTQNACVNLTLSNAVSTLPSGAYQGQVFLTSSSGATATIYVNLYVSAGAAVGVTVQPGLIYQFSNVASNSSVVQQAQFSITAQAGYTTSIAALSSSANGFSMSTPVANNNTQTFTITSNSAGLVTGLYSTTVTMQSAANGSTNTTTITIVLPVGQPGVTTTGNGGTGSTTVVPASLAFQQQLGSSYWTSQKEQQQLTITGTAGTSWSASIVYAGATGWLTFDSASAGTFGNTPATLLVDLYNGVTSLTPSTTPYAATIDITTPNGVATVSVSLLVTPQTQAVLLGNPASATFYATSGTGTPSQTVTVVGSDNTGSTTNPPLIIGTPTAMWVSATSNGNTMTISVNATGQNTGIYSATIPVSANAYSNAINYPVVLVVNGGGNGGSTGSTGPLTLSPNPITFTNVTSSITQNLNVTAANSTNFTVTYQETSCTSASWLQVATGPYTASASNTPISVSVNPGSIANGTTCTGVITLVSTGSSGGTQAVNVSMTVATSNGSGNVTVSPTTMSFAYTQNQSVPSAQTATIVNTATGTASITFTVATAVQSGTSVNWLQTNVMAASTPYNSPGLSVSVAPGNLPPGTYQGTVTISPTGGSQQTINVTLTVNGNAVVTATPTTISLTYNVGGNSPTSTILVSAGGSAANFTATAASSLSWLAVTPTSGLTPNTGTFNLTVSAVASVLSTLAPSSTPYTGTITVQGTSPASGSTIVNVSLLVTAPLPVITGVINAASGATGPVAPGEIISIFGTAANPIGPAASVALSSTTCPSPCTQVPIAMGGVQVKFLPGGQFAPLLFVSQSQINAVVPYGVVSQAGLGVEVLYLNQTSNIDQIGEVATAPGIFVAPGSSQAAALQFDTQGNVTYNTSATPAKAGWILELYVTGEGVVIPAATTGSVTVAASAPPYTPVPAAGKPNVLIGNQPATLSFYGEAPNYVSGLMQLNVVVPPGAGTGPVNIVVTIGGNSTQANVTVFLQ